MNNGTTNVDHGYTTKMLVVDGAGKGLVVEGKAEIPNVRNYLEMYPYATITAVDTNKGLQNKKEEDIMH